MRTCETVGVVMGICDGHKNRSMLESGRRKPHAPSASGAGQDGVYECQESQ